MPASGTPGDRPRRVFFHIGAPKTGTTFLQNVLFDNRDELAADGVLYPYSDRGQSFRSMQDFRGAGWGAQGPEAFAGQWEAVAGRIRAWRGHTVIVSNELFAGTESARIGAGLATLAEGDDGTPLEVHVVFTARDFARQLVSDWQEQVKHGHTVTLDTFVDDLLELGLDAPPPFGELFWGMHDAAPILRKWSEHVHADRIHLITIPPPGGPKGALWHRFCAVTGLLSDRYDTETRRKNLSMGVAETEFVRRINSDVRGIGQHQYDFFVRRFLAEECLGNQSARLTLPRRFLPTVAQRSQQLVADLARAGYRIEGDLSELLPRAEDHEPNVDPADVTEAQLGEVASRAAVGLLRRAARLRDKVLELQDRPPPTPPPSGWARLRPVRTVPRRAAARARRRLRTRREGG